MSSLRVVLDTNVLVSGLAYPGSVPGRIVSTWRDGGLDVVLSRDILDELTRVLPRLERIHMTPAEIRDLVDSLMFIADVVEPDGVPDAKLRDPAPLPRRAPAGPAFGWVSCLNPAYDSHVLIAAGACQASARA